MYSCVGSFSEAQCFVCFVCDKVNVSVKGKIVSEVNYKVFEGCCRCQLVVVYTVGVLYWCE